jgi:hypothetical protein
VNRVVIASVVILGLGCSEPGSGGGVFADTSGDGDDTEAPSPEVMEDSAPPETETLAPETNLEDTAPAETEPPLDTTPADTAPADTEPADTVVADTAPGPDTQDAQAPVDTAPEATDTAGSGLCSYQTDCYPKRLCGRWAKTGELRCSDPCAGDSDCAAGQICSKVPGSLQVGYCQEAPAGQANGAPCASDGECRSRLCADGACAALCLDEAHCATPGMTCHLSGDLAIGLLTSVCSPDQAQSIGNGQLCSSRSARRRWRASSRRSTCRRSGWPPPATRPRDRGPSSGSASSADARRQPGESRNRR